MTTCAFCSKYPTWTCDGCRKNLCGDHQDMRKHKCRLCQFCSKTATVFHDSCGKYVCDYYGCERHIRACHHDNTDYGIKVACPMCVNGRIVTGWNTSERCFVCNGNCSI